MCELINYINLHIGEDLSLKTLGRVTNYNPTYLSRTFKSITRSTLKLYIDEKRINTATLLMGKGTPLTEIAMEVGFQNYCTFYNTFRRIMGVSRKAMPRPTAAANPTAAACCPGRETADPFPPHPIPKEVFSWQWYSWISIPISWR